MQVFTKSIFMVCFCYLHGVNVPVGTHVEGKKYNSKIQTIERTLKMKNVKASDNRAHSGVTLFRLVEILFAVFSLCIIMTFSLGAAVRWSMKLPKIQAAHLYERVCEVRLLGEPVNDSVTVTVFNESGDELVTASHLIGTQYTYTKSVVDEGYFPDRSFEKLQIKLFPGVTLTDSERSVLWKRVTVCQTAGYPDIEDVTAYFVGPLPVGAPVKHKLRLTTQ